MLTELVLFVALFFTAYDVVLMLIAAVMRVVTVLSHRYRGSTFEDALKKGYRIAKPVTVLRIAAHILTVATCLWLIGVLSTIAITVLVWAVVAILYMLVRRHRAAVEL